MLLPALGLVRLEEALRAEVVGALVAPDHGVRQAALAALHLDEAAVVPEELVRDAVVEVLAEAPDHGVDRLQPVGGQVQVPTGVVLHHGLPLGRQRVPEREQAVPVPRRVVADAELRGHVLDDLRRDHGLLHVVRVPAAPQEDPHGAQALELVDRGPRVQHVRPGGALLGQAELVELHVEVVAVLQARLHHQVLVHVDLAALPGAESGLLLLQLRVRRGLRLRVERQVRLDPLRDLAERQGLEGLLRKRAEPQGVGELHLLHLLVRVDGALGVPAVEGVDRLAGVGADDAVGVREAPSVGMAHHHVHKVHAHVEEVLLPPLELEPEGAVHVHGVHLLELLPGVLVVDVELAEEGRIAADLERLVHDVVEAGAEHLRPLGAAAGRALQRHPHVGRLDVRSEAASRGAHAQVCLVGRSLRPGHADLLPHELGERGDRLEVLVLQVHRDVAADKRLARLAHEVSLRARHLVRRRRRGSRVRHLAARRRVGVLLG
mmetsp:Transcript_61346/g.161214  ORF Transcript_61346/g.161214 Transcript_61346/m.161214 type:complete len:491 (-) Transcript_61346:158-1630(-)